jgi:hypothetical protein
MELSGLTAIPLYRGEISHATDWTGDRVGLRAGIEGKSVSYSAASQTGCFAVVQLICAKGT